MHETSRSMAWDDGGGICGCGGDAMGGGVAGVSAVGGVAGSGSWGRRCVVDAREPVEAGTRRMGGGGDHVCGLLSADEGTIG